MIRQIDPRDEAAVRALARVEQRLLGHHEHWIRPIDAELRRRLTGRSAFLTETRSAIFAAGDGHDVAHCVAFVNARYARAKGERVGFVGHFAVERGAVDEGIGLLERAETWLRERGCVRALGPVDGAPLAGGLALVDGFDESPMFPHPWTPPHYPDLFAHAGWQTAHRLWAYELELGASAYRNRAARARAAAPCTVRPADSRRWRDEVEALARLLNAGYDAGHWEAQRFTVDEILELLAPARPAVERQLFFAEIDGRPVGSILGMHDLNPLLRSFRGRSGAWQAVQRRLHGRRLERAGVLDLVVAPEERRRGIASALVATLLDVYAAEGLTRALYYLVNEENAPARALAESFGGRGRVRYAVYGKTL